MRYILLFCFVWLLNTSCNNTSTNPPDDPDNGTSGPSVVVSFEGETIILNEGVTTTASPYNGRIRLSINAAKGLGTATASRVIIGGDFPETPGTYNLTNDDRYELQFFHKGGSQGIADKATFVISSLSASSSGTLKMKATFNSATNKGPLGTPISGTIEIK